MPPKRTKKIPTTLPNTSVELLRKKSVLLDLISSNQIQSDWFSTLFTLDVVDDFVAQATNVSPTYFANKLILNREGLLVFIRTQFPQGFNKRFVSNSKYGAAFLDELLLKETFDIIFRESYGTCSGQISEGYASYAFENMKKYLNIFDIAVILEVNTRTTAGVSLLDKYDPLTEYKKTLKSGQEVDITEYYEFLTRPDVRGRIKNETYESEPEVDLDSDEEDDDGGIDWKNEFHIIYHVKNRLAKILNTNKIIAFIISELGECKLPSPPYPMEDVWSINLICGGSGGNGAYLISLFLFSVIVGSQMGKWPPIGVLELAGGYKNTAGLCLYTKFGFRVDSSIRSSRCFEDYHNLPHIADFRSLDLDDTKQKMINLLTSKTPIAPFYRHPLCYIKHTDLQTALAILLNLRESFYNGTYQYAYDRYYFDRFLTAVSVILQKQLLNKYNSSTLRTDLDEIIKRLFLISKVDPSDIENTYNNSIVTLSPIDQSRIDSIVNPPPTPPPSPPTTPTTTSAVKPRTPSPTTTSAVQPTTTPTYCDTSSNSGCVVSGGRKKTRKSRKARKGRKRKSRRTRKYLKRSKKYSRII
jgi:hypothetical protein